MIQATTWKDAKLVGFLHNHVAEDMADHTAERGLPPTKRKTRFQVMR
jgi:hypothetical protein